MVDIGGRSDADHLNGGMRNQFSVIGKSMGHVMLLGKRLGPARGALTHSNDLHIATGPIAEQMHKAKSCADDSHAEGVLNSLFHAVLLLLDESPVILRTTLETSKERHEAPGSCPPRRLAPNIV